VYLLLKSGRGMVLTGVIFDRIGYGEVDHLDEIDASYIHITPSTHDVS